MLGWVGFNLTCQTFSESEGVVEMSSIEQLKLRESDRLDTALVVAVKSSWGPAKADYHVSKDISEHGVFLMDEHPPELEADLMMEFSLPTRGVHLTRCGEIFYGWVEGRVVRVEACGYAVQFEDEFNLTIPHRSSGDSSH
jgi:hypothetical protein